MSQFDKNQRPQLRFVPDAPLRMVFFYFRPAHPDGIAYDQLADLKAYTVGTMLGSATTRSLRAVGVTVKEGPSLEGMFENLASGRIDLVTALDLRGMAIINDRFPESRGDFEQLPHPLKRLFGGLVFHRSSHSGRRLADRYAAGIAQIKASGAYLRILEKYYGPGNVPVDILTTLKLDDR